MEGNTALVIFGAILLLIAPELIKFIQACVQEESEQ